MQHVLLLKGVLGAVYILSPAGTNSFDTLYLTWIEQTVLFSTAKDWAYGGW